MVKNLSVFSAMPKGMPRNRELAVQTLTQPGVRKVVCCALGPKGNNIEQASALWSKSLGIERKYEMFLRDTPELCLELARSITQDGAVAVFWTCAVYARENEFFFGNPDVFPFFFEQVMPLDEMQLACKPANKPLIGNNGDLPHSLRIASHPSPAPLVKGTGQVVLQNSNAAAARACANGETEMCITTESARKIYGLAKIHSFGSPDMVFFGGITQHGARVIARTYQEWRNSDRMPEKLYLLAASLGE